MIKTIEDMALLIILKVSSYMLKCSLIWLGALSIFQNIDYEIFEILANGFLSVTAQWIGFLYLIFIVAKKGVDLWEHWRKARFRVKEEFEKYKQAKIETCNKRKKLDE